MAMKTYVKGTGYKNGTPKGRASIKAHLKYIENRPNEKGEREKRKMFNENGKTSREEFQDKLDKQPNTGVNGHKVVISMDRKDQESGNIDMEELTKQSMAALEAKMGVKLEWIGTIHDKKSNPHAHVVIAGRDKDGKEVRLTKRELEWLKNRIDMEQKRQRERNMGRGITPISIEIPSLKQLILDRANSLEKTIKGLGNGNSGHGGGIGSIKAKILQDREENER